MKALNKLDNVIEKLPGRAFFRKPATEKAVADLEREMGSELPEAYKAFLTVHDGGFIHEEAILEEELAESLGDAAWNSNVLLGVEEIRAQFADMKTVLAAAAEVFGEVDGIYIPFCHTSGQELLVFKGPLKGTADAEVLDAFHEVPPSCWEPVYASFAELLDEYVRTEGEIKTAS